jgi:chromate transporter
VDLMWAPIASLGRTPTRRHLQVWLQALVSTIGIFLPSFLLVLIVAPILARHRENANVQGFVKGAYGAAIGTILGACILLGKITISDWLTAAIGIISFAVLFR